MFYSGLPDTRLLLTITYVYVPGPNRGFEVEGVRLVNVLPTLIVWIDNFSTKWNPNTGKFMVNIFICVYSPIEPSTSITLANSLSHFKSGLNTYLYTEFFKIRQLDNISAYMLIVIIHVRNMPISIYNAPLSCCKWDIDAVSMQVLLSLQQSP